MTSRQKRQERMDERIKQNGARNFRLFKKALQDTEGLDPWADRLTFFAIGMATGWIITAVLITTV